MIKRNLLVIAYVALVLLVSAASAKPATPSPQSLVRAFACIHRYEGAWTANTNNGFYGGLQFNASFERTYGPEFVRMWGHAHRWPVAVQLAVAMRAYYHRSFAPWPNTRKRCGL